MAEPFIAEIRPFGFNFAPRGWAQCNGQIMSISQNTAVFALVGTLYGGNGQTTFGLPNLQGRVAIGAGGGPGLSIYDLGQIGGSATVTLSQAELPTHNHSVVASTTPLGTIAAPNTNVGYSRAGNGNLYGSAGNETTLAPAALSPAGGSQPHNNLQPYGVINYCIALQGVFPPRS